ncbi:MAG: hypothetical protein E6L04_03360 [Thaumarchaeota archaeon]|jgi:hypothetical protein|nr:MAG: hypothetical protein E6K97_11440 [Nitrososphaerota archaeon]TLX86648.1 MAG: hypothetical protein E6L04_03360 [Nitrososphaerota archaeon]
MLFGRNKIKDGDYVFVSQEYSEKIRLVIGRIISLTDSIARIRGSYVIPLGLIEKVSSGRGEGRPREVLQNPDPNNCIFMLIDNVETGNFDEEIDINSSKIKWINEERFHVLDGWIKENLPEVFANVLRAKSNEDRIQARTILLEKMNSLYERDLKDHMYAVARSTKIL